MDKFTKSELDSFRPTLQAYGKLFGRALICPVCDNLDLNFNQKVKDGKNPRLNEPMKKYRTNMVTMTSFDLDKDAEDRPVLIINKDPNTTFPIKGNEKLTVEDCTIEKVNQAIRDYKENKKLTFFTDVETVKKIIMNMNEQNAKECMALAEELVNFGNALRNLNKTEETELSNYLKTIE